MVIDLKKLRETLQVEKDDENTGYISVNELRSALAIAAARTDVEKEIDKELCKLKEQTPFKNKDLEEDYKNSMFECIQYLREAGHFKDLDKM